MVLVTDSQKIEDSGDTLFWTRRLSLTARILAVNIFAIAIIAGSFFYLDSYRTRLIDERLGRAEERVAAAAAALDRIAPDEHEAYLIDAAKQNASRLRIFRAADGLKTVDSFAMAEPTYTLRDPDTEAWQRHAARWLDRAIDTIVNAPEIGMYAEKLPDHLGNWNAARDLDAQNALNAEVLYAPDRTPMISAAAAFMDGRYVLISTHNARDITRIVRDERFNLAVIVVITMILAILLSLFLARTIVLPLRNLAKAAIAVRRGRERNVEVPRLPDRGDEIGMLARALSDMTEALRRKIDATEAFAADVAHEIKNPLASLRSALEGMERVEDPKLRKKLIDVATSDVIRLDRLITDISEASRVDAQLTRTRFLPVDMGEMIDNLLMAREDRGVNKNIPIAFARPGKGLTVTFGEAGRLEQVVNNLLDNAVSFSPKDGLVEIVATRIDDTIIIDISDEGPGVPTEQREDIFRRFHTARPDESDFGKHSGLGLAISRSIIEAHQGAIWVCDRDDGGRGARFRITMPAVPSNIILVGQ